MPELIAEALGAVGEELADWLDLTPLDPAYRALLPGRLHAGRASPTPPGWPAEISRVCGAPGGRRLPAVRRRTPASCGGWSATDFIDRNLDAPDRPAHRQPAQAARRRRLPAAPDEDQPVLPGPPHPADLLLPGDVRRASPRTTRWPSTRSSRTSTRWPGSTSRAAASTRSPGRWPARPRSTACRSGTTPRSTRVETAQRPGHRRGAPPTASGSRPTWWCSTPTCRSPTATCCPRPRRAAPAALLAVLRGAARRLRPGVREDRPPQHPLRTGLEGHLRRGDPARAS